MMKYLNWIAGYLAEFTLCSLCGWIYEELTELIVYHAYDDRGLLHLPLCPIYGFAGLLLVLLFRRRNDWPFVFVVSAAVTTALELAASYALEKIGYVPWDYADWPCNFEGRISLLSSLIFGGLAVLLVKAVHPLCRRFAEHPRIATPVGIACGLVIAADAIRTFLL